jgi:hypothetical protein
VVEDPTCQNKNFHKFLSGNVERISFPPFFLSYPSLFIFLRYNFASPFLILFCLKIFLYLFYPLVLFLYFSVSLMPALLLRRSF